MPGRTCAFRLRRREPASGEIWVNHAPRVRFAGSDKQRTRRSSSQTDAIAALRLGLVEGLIGCREGSARFGEAEHVRKAGREGDAADRGIVFAVDQATLRKGLANRVETVPDCVQPHATKEEDELFSAVASDAAAVVRYPRQCANDRPDNPVAGVVTMAIVDDLEAVDILDRDGQRVDGFPGFAVLAHQNRLEGPSVGQAGEMVEVGVAPCAREPLAQAGDLLLAAAHVGLVQLAPFRHRACQVKQIDRAHAVGSATFEPVGVERQFDPVARRGLGCLPRGFGKARQRPVEIASNSSWRSANSGSPTIASSSQSWVIAWRSNSRTAMRRPSSRCPPEKAAWDITRLRAETSSWFPSRKLPTLPSRSRRAPSPAFASTPVASGRSSPGRLCVSRLANLQKRIADGLRHERNAAVTSASLRLRAQSPSQYCVSARSRA